MRETIFVNLLADVEKAEAVCDAIQACREGHSLPSVVFSIDLSSLASVAGMPFAYWVGQKVLQLFSNLPPVEGAERTAKQGLATADDFRFLRLWFEIPPSQTVTG